MGRGRGSWVVGVGRECGYKKTTERKKIINRTKSFKIHDTKCPRTHQSHSPFQRSAKQIFKANPYSKRTLRGHLGEIVSTVYYVTLANTWGMNCAFLKMSTLETETSFQFKEVNDIQ